MTTFKRIRMLCGTSSAMALALAINPVFAQQVDPDDHEDETALEEIVVQGFRSSIENSIAAKRGNSSIVEAISAEDIGKLPDVSIAESLARLPGLTTQRVDGRGQVLSIRGLGPDFSTALLNGREQVSTSDNRGVEFDQYPAELLSAAVVYKTPDATLIGQGLTGTVDLRTIRPLDIKERILSVNGFYEFNENSSLNPDQPRAGFRASAIYADKFLDNTLGFSLGIAHQSTPTQSERFNAWGFPTVEGDLDVNGTTPFVIGGAKPFAQSNDLNRFGVIGTIQYQPSDSFSTSLDFNYSHFDETQSLRGIELPLFWSAAQLQPGFTEVDGLITEGVFTDVKGVMRNDRNDRNADLFGAGWNVRAKVTDHWSVESDISYSRADRKDSLIETITGTGPAGEGITDTLGFRIQDNGVVRFDSSIDYSDPSLFFLTDPQGWGAGAQPNPLTQAGFINAPKTEDELTHLRFSAERAGYIGPISAITFGVDLSRRDKERAISQTFLVPAGGATALPVPQEAILDKSTSLEFIGIDGHLSLDPLFLIDNGFLERVPTSLSSFDVPQDWKVREDVAIAYVKFDVETDILSIPVTGNFGTQIVFTDQESTGSRIESVDLGSGVSEPMLVPTQEGDKYTRFLPSMNLSFDLGHETVMRFGAARTLARSRMDQLNSSLSLSTNDTQLRSTDPNQAFFSASGGNAELKPFIANSVDLSFEKYFSQAGYVALAFFYKDLQDFVNPNDAFLFDFTDFVDSTLSPEQVAELGTTLGTISGPTNNGRGNIGGVEFTLSLPLDFISMALDGFGVISSASWTDSRVILGDNPDPISVPGLSKWVVNSTAYYEKYGFSARISHRYRGSFLGEVSGISATRILRSSKSESIFDAQIGYAFETGPLEGLNVTFQARNLTDEPFVTFEGDDGRRVIDQQKFGRTYLVGLSYKF
ncbi:MULTISPECIES: TonB-dependent receptor [unclassified Iodidimonas]|uniref:TonB-dependent receptor n=1 Tax=unclassified Iodidimonas TaxID=2626145 RepID=UPI002482C8F0|nr:MULTISPECIES: TonB-dependent receptor [unclassified Iodidimonas]